MMNKNRLNPLLSLLLIFLGAPLLAALLSPWIYWLIQAHAPAGMQWVQTALADGPNLWADLGESVWTSPFRRVNERVVLVLVLLFLAPAYRLSELKGRADFGLCKRADWARLFGFGLVVAAASMLIPYVIGLMAGVYAPVPLAPDWGAQVLKIVVGMLLIGVIEEVVFRGFILNALRKSLGPAAAVLLSSALFAAVHFIKPAEPSAVDHWYSGFLLLAHPFSAAGNTLIPELSTLFCMGSVLATLSLWTRSVYLAVGLHAGWVWIMMLFRLFTENQGVLSALYGPGEWISKGWVGPIMALFVWAATWFSRKYWHSLGDAA